MPDKMSQTHYFITQDELITIREVSFEIAFPCVLRRKLNTGMGYLSR